MKSVILGDQGNPQLLSSVCDEFDQESVGKNRIHDI